MIDRTTTRGVGAAHSRLPSPRSAACLLLAGVLAACSAAPVTKGRGEKRAAVAENGKLPLETYFPLATSSRWTYRINDFSKRWTYQNKVRVQGPKRYERLSDQAIEVIERYSSDTAPFYVEESEPVVYFRKDGYLHRVFMTQQAGKLVQSSGSGDSRFLPTTLVPGSSWESDSEAFRVGELGFNVKHRHDVVREAKAIRVPAGAFENCIRIDTSSAQPNSAKDGGELVFYYSDWYAPDVGLVKTEHWDDKGRKNLRTRIELLDYEIGPKEPAPSRRGAS